MPFNLLDKFRFTADPDGTPETLSPVNDGLKKRWEREGEGRFYRQKLGTKLLMRGADFTYFKAKLEAGTCENVTVLIEQYCSGEWVEFFTGTALIFEGSYDYDKCEAEIELKPDDLMECFVNNYEKKFNWINLVSEVFSYSLYGTIETTTCNFSGTPPGGNEANWFYKGCWDSGFTNSSDPDPALAWRPLTHTQTVIISPTGFTASTEWARETVTQVATPPGNGWINIGGNVWVRPITYASDPVEETAGLTRTFDAEAADVEMSNGIPLAGVLPEIVDLLDCGIDEVVSDFFGIDPDSTNPTNNAYDYAKDDEGVMQNVLIYQKSDVVNAAASDDATRLEMSLKDFLDSIAHGSLNVFWTITESGGTVTLRIEHISYFEGTPGIDLTTLESGLYIRGLHRFEVTDGVPAFEQFAYQESYKSEFLPQRLNYDESCIKNPKQDYTLTQMSADVPGLLDNPDAGLTGFVFVCAYQSGASPYIIDSTSGVLNGAMMWANLFENLLQYNRYSADLTPDVGTVTVETIRKRKKQAAIKMPFCCDTLDPSELVVTQMGNGEIESAEQDTKAGLLTLNLMHE